jgi:hypothetical protein
MDRETGRRGDVLHLTFRGIEICEETIWYVRSLCRHAAAALTSPARFEVTLERAEGLNDVHATVRAIAWRGTVEAVQIDPDELLAVRNAFAVLGERLKQRMTPIFA